MSDIKTNMLPETPDHSDQIRVLSEQSNHPPIRERVFNFPEGHRKWGRPEDGVVQVSLGSRAYRAVTEHARRETHREVGGLLLGQIFQGENRGTFQVSVDEALPDHRGVGRSATFAFTHESWGALCDEAKERFPSSRIVGWYHSHPNFGVFYSGTDQASHRTYFDKPWLVGLVVDPIRNQGGFFASDSHGVSQLPGFYERVEDEGRFVNWSNAIPPHHTGQAVTPTRERSRPQGYSERESRINEKQSFRSRLSEEIPLPFAFVFFIIFGLSLFAILFSVFSYSRLETRVRELEDKARTQENLAPTFIRTPFPPPVQDGSFQPPPTPNTVAPVTYTVMEGDTLESIAQRYNVTVEAILNSNRHIQDANHLASGQPIIIPLGAGGQQP